VFKDCTYVHAMKPANMADDILLESFSYGLGDSPNGPRKDFTLFYRSSEVLEQVRKTVRQLELAVEFPKGTHVLELLVHDALQSNYAQDKCQAIMRYAPVFSNEAGAHETLLGFFHARRAVGLDADVELQMPYQALVQHCRAIGLTRVWEDDNGVQFGLVG
jgi:hypothetical protein